MAAEAAAAGSALSRLFVLVRGAATRDASFYCACVAQPAKEWLASSPRGAYTTARTYGRDKVLFLDAHIERLATSAAAMGASDGGLGPPPDALTDVSALRSSLLPQLAAGLDFFYAQPAAAEAAEEARADCDARLTVLLTWGSPTDGAPQPWDCLVHVAALPPRRPPPVHAVVREAARHNAAAKDSLWVSQKKDLHRPDGVEEVLLAVRAGGDAEGHCVLEGSETNFFAAMGGKLYTADDGILNGTVRRMVLSECEKAGIEVVRTAPALRSARRWEGAFICSTSRLVMPLQRVAVPAGLAGAAEDVHLAWDETCEVVKRVEGLVEAHVAENATPVTPSCG